MFPGKIQQSDSEKQGQEPLPRKKQQRDSDQNQAEPEKVLQQSKDHPENRQIPKRHLSPDEKIHGEARYDEWNEKKGKKEQQKADRGQQTQNSLVFLYPRKNHPPSSRAELGRCLPSFDIRPRSTGIPEILSRGKPFATKRPL